MSTPPPAMFDDGGGLPQTRRDLAADRDRDRDGEWGDDGEYDEPNYFVRRAIVTAIVVGVIAVLAVVVAQFLNGDDGATDGTDASAWNRIVALTTDRIVVIDPETGEVEHEYTPVESPSATPHAAFGSSIVLAEDDGSLIVLDLTDGAVRRTRGEPDPVLFQVGANPAIVAAGATRGGDITLVDMRVGETMRVASIAGLDDPLILSNTVIVNPAGTHAAVADAATFQSVLVDIENETAELLAGRVVAIDDSSVVTAQRAGAETELEFYDLTGERRASVDVPTPTAILLTGEGSALIGTFDGRIATVSTGGTFDEVGTVAGDAGEPADITGGVAVLDGERLLVTTGDEVIVLDRGGAILGRAPGQMTSFPRRGDRCVAVGEFDVAGTAVHLDVESGEVLGDVPGGPVGSRSADGCVLAYPASEGAAVVARGVAITTEAADRVAFVAPSGTHFVTRTREGLTLFETDADDDAEPIVLLDEPANVAFANL